MKKKFVLFALAAITLSLASCGGSQTAAKEATGYGVVHKDYIGMATMTVKNKKVETLDIDEAFTPYTWAALTNESATTLGEDNYLSYDVTKNGTTTTKYYAKYILIGGEKFTGALRSADLVVGEVTYSNEKVVYSSTDTPDLFKSWLESETACENYIKFYRDCNFAIADADFKLSSVLPTFTSGKYKSEGLYWNKLYGAGSGVLGWLGNISKIKAALIGTSMGETDFVKDEETNEWKINGVATGATIADFKDYYSICQKAYNKLVK